jgi:hypothetical protein
MAFREIYFLNEHLMPGNSLLAYGTVGIWRMSLDDQSPEPEGRHQAPVNVVRTTEYGSSGDRIQFYERWGGGSNEELCVLPRSAPQSAVPRETTTPLEISARSSSLVAEQFPSRSLYYYDYHPDS